MPFNPHQNAPQELLDYPYWTTHINKRPLAGPGHFNECRKFVELNGRKNKGLQLSREYTLACIDVDFASDSISREEALNLPQVKSLPWDSQEYEEWLLEQEWMLSAAAAGVLKLIHKTYTELSLSGLGLHIFLHLVDKEETQECFIKSKNPVYKGQLSVANSFITSTGIKLFSSPSSLVMASIFSFPKAFSNQSQSVSATNATKAPPAQNQESISVDIGMADIAFSKIERAISLLPPSPTKYLQQKWQEVTGKAYEHYDYWITVGMALNSYGSETNTLTECFKLYLDWSARDEDSFKGDADVESHWVSFGQSRDRQNVITARTLIRLAGEVAFQYPKPVYKDGKRTRYPDTNEFDNFSYLMDRYAITLYCDQGNTFYINGDDEVISRYFTFPSIRTPHLGRYFGPYTEEQLITATTRLCQASDWKKFPISTTQVKLWRSYAKQLDLFQEWLDTPFESLPNEYQLAADGNDARRYNENSTIDFLYDCLDVQYISPDNHREEEELYHACLEKTLMHIIKYRLDNVRSTYRSDSGGMLILLGPEHSYKSTYCRMLLPLPLQFLRKEVNQKVDNTKAERDFIRYLGSRVIVQLDEFEGMINMKTSSAFFKNLLSSDMMSQTEIYAKSETLAQRKAIIIATTNEATHVLSRDGSRRLWFIPTGNIRVNELIRFNHHYFYSNLRDNITRQLNKNTLPWQFTQQQSLLRSQWNEGHAAQSSLGAALEEMFAFTSSTMPDLYLKTVTLQSAKGRQLKCMSTLEIMHLLQNNGLRVNIAQLKHELTRYCSIWTGTVRKDKEIRKVFKIIKGKACQNWYEPRKRYQYEYWVVPPLRQQIPVEFQQEVEEE